MPLQHRPLPSVDIALLPHELRAIRMQRLAIAGGVAFVVLLGIGIAYAKGAFSHTKGRRAAADSDELASAEASAEAMRGHPPMTNVARREKLQTALQPVLGDNPPGHVEHRFGRARSFREALMQSGATPSESGELIAALAKVVDFRRGKPDDRLIFDRDADNRLRSFEYRASVTEVYRAVRDEHGVLRGVKVDVPIERKRIEKGIYIAGTLGESLDALGLGSSLAGTVTAAFNGRISFTRDTRSGDSVKLILDEEYVDGGFLRYGTVYAMEYASARAGKLQAFWFDPDGRSGEYFDASGRALHGGWLRAPLRYDYISSPYNLKRRHPILKRIMPHLGIDYSAATGTPIWAAADGVVTFAGPRGPNGNLISLRHNNGYETKYAHLWKISPGIKPGVHVKQRQVLGFVGSTGRSTGPHLHFALKRYGHFLDPASQWNGPGEALPASELARFRAATQPLREQLDHVSLAPAPSVDSSAKPDDDNDDDDDDL